MGVLVSKNGPGTLYRCFDPVRIVLDSEPLDCWDSLGLLRRFVFDYVLKLRWLFQSRILGSTTVDGTSVGQTTPASAGRSFWATIHQPSALRR